MCGSEGRSGGSGSGRALRYFRLRARRQAAAAGLDRGLGDRVAAGAAGGDPGQGGVADLVDRGLRRRAEGGAARQIGHDRELAVVIVAPEHLDQVLHGVGPYFSIIRTSCRA